MKRIPTAILAFLLGVSCTIGASAAASGPWRAERELVEDARQELQEISALVAHAESPRVRARILRQIDNLDSTLYDLEGHLDPAYGAGNGGATSSQEMTSILSALSAESFSDGRLSALRSISSDRWFTVEQVRQILHQFPFSDDQIEAAAMLYPKVSDPERWYTIYSEFTFTSDREALRARTQ